MKIPQVQKHYKFLDKEFLLYNFAHTFFFFFWTISTTSLLLIPTYNLIIPRLVFPTLAFLLYFAIYLAIYWELALG